MTTTSPMTCRQALVSVFLKVRDLQEVPFVACLFLSFALGMALPALVHPSLFDVRTDLCSVGRVVLPVTTMLSVDELIYTCTLTCPSVLGSLSHLWFFCLLCQ